MGGKQQQGHASSQRPGGRVGTAAQAQPQRKQRGTDKGQHGQNRGQAQRSKRFRAQVQGVRHGERIFGHIVLGQHGADVGRVRQVARIPQTRQQSASRHHPNDGNRARGAEQPGAAALLPFVPRHGIGNQQQQRQISREGVILLVSGDGEE